MNQEGVSISKTDPPNIEEYLASHLKAVSESGQKGQKQLTLFGNPWGAKARQATDKLNDIMANMSKHGEKWKVCETAVVALAKKRCSRF